MSRNYAVRTYLDDIGDYGYLSIDFDDVVFGSIYYAYVFKKRHAKKMVKKLRALYPNDEFEIVKIP